MAKKHSKEISFQLKDVQGVLLAAAQTVQKRAYAPYSRFRVGAALIDDAGMIHVGTNVENASYGGTICAERSAVCSMVAHGGKAIKAVVIATDKGTPPCGFCRQVMAEFAAPSTPILIAGKKGIVEAYRLGDLLPDSFGPKNLIRRR